MSTNTHDDPIMFSNIIDIRANTHTQTSKNESVIMCRRWRPSQLKFDDFFEIMIEELDSQTDILAHLRSVLASNSGIALDRLTIAKVL